MYGDCNLEKSYFESQNNIVSINLNKHELV